MIFPLFAVAAILILPFLHSDQTVDMDLAPKFVGMAVLAACVQAWLCLRGRKEEGSSPLHWAAWIFAGHAVLSFGALAWAVNAREGVFDWLRTALTALLLFQAMRLMAATGEAPVRSVLVRCMILFALAASGLGLYALALLPEGGYTLASLYGITGTFAHKNLFSSIVFLSLPFGLYAVLCLRGPWRWAGALCLILGLAVILALQTRATWVAVAIAAAAGVALGLLRPTASPAPSVRGVRKVRAAVVLGLILVLTASAWFFRGAYPEAFRERVTSSWETGKNEWRLITWRKSLYLARDNLWTGVGPGNWKIEFLRYGTEDIRRAGGETEGEEEETAFIRPHNDFLWVLGETGIGGALTYLAFFLAVLGVCVRLRMRVRDPEARVYAICMAMGVVGYMVDACFSFPRERISHGVFLVLMAASVLAFPARDKDGAPVRRLPGGRLADWAMLALALSALVIGCIRLEAEKSVRQALQARAEQRWDDVLTHLVEVNRTLYPLDPMGNPIRFYAGTAHFLKGNAEQAWAAFADALRDHPFHAHTLNNLGTSTQLAGDPLKAIDFYSRALQVRPGFADAWLNGAAVYYNLGDDDRARDWLSRLPPMPADPRWKKLSALLDSNSTGSIP